MDECPYSLVETEPGHSIIVLKESEKAEKIGVNFMLDILQRWREMYPLRVVTDVQIIRQGSMPRSMTVFWYEKPIRDVSMEVHETVIARHGKEYIEAVVKDAVELITNPKYELNIAAMISKREVAAVLFRRLNHCIVSTYEDLLCMLPANISLEVQETFEVFKQQGEVGYHVVRFPDDFKPVVGNDERA